MRASATVYCSKRDYRQDGYGWVTHTNSVNARILGSILACEFVKEWIALNHDGDARRIYLDGINLEVLDKDQIRIQDFYALCPQMHEMPNAVRLLVGDCVSIPYFYNRPRVRSENSKNYDACLCKSILELEATKNFLNFCIFMV